MTATIGWQNGLTMRTTTSNAFTDVELEEMDPDDCDAYWLEVERERDEAAAELAAEYERIM